MTAEKFMGDLEEYPRGLRVLAVDDDPICLKLLKTLLQKCQYQVETANQARVALKMLRENKNRFDLVISDVHMPDMDGFKLLELVGLEMDLPVIMLSANSDPKLVLKGVTHGACDYLVKPVRIEELSNIWQHVIRRKKLDHKGQTGFSDQTKTFQQIGEAQVHENQDVNVNRKRKDDDEDSEGDDPVSQKKPRVVWSMVLHRKFVAAVNQLGYDKAVPKRILDLMNVEGLTRENVASHLQKYRLYLKRINSDAKHAAALNSQGIPPYAASLADMYFSAAGSLGTSVVSPYTTGGVLGRRDTYSSLSNIRGLTSPSLIQMNHARNVNGLGGTLSSLPSMTQNPSLYSGSMNLDQFQMNKDSLDVVNIDQSRIYEASSMLNGRAGSSTSILNGAGGFRNHTSHNLATFNSAGLSASTSSILHDAISSKMQSNSLAEAPFHTQFSVNTKGDNDFSTSPYLQNETNSLLNPAQATSLRWGVQGLDYNHGSNAGGSSNYGIGITTRTTSTFTNDRGSSTPMQQNNKNFAPETRTMADEAFPLGQTKLPDELFIRGYDTLDEMVSSMMKREEDDAVASCDFKFDDYSYRL